MSSASVACSMAGAFSAEPDQVLLFPARPASRIALRYAPLTSRDNFNPSKWNSVPLSSDKPGWFSLDISTLALADGDYEYEFVVDGTPVADPYAREITRFGGYRGVLHIRNGKRATQTFDWSDETTDASPLRNNNQIVIYEMPLRWMDGDRDRQVDLGTFDEAIFEHLNAIADAGFNAIELLPVQDSPDTLNWGYGTRFFFAPDYDLGTPTDAKCFIKTCHQLGIRVILDVVMNHSRECPLERSAADLFYLQNEHDEGDRNAWGGKLFRYATPVDGEFVAREFQCQMAEYWIREYHVDGFRLDEFKSINNWNFVQEFRDRAWAEHDRHFPERPFIVIAEDSSTRVEITRDGSPNSNGRKTVDAAWNFLFQAESRRAIAGRVVTEWGQPAKRERFAGMITGDNCGTTGRTRFDPRDSATWHNRSHTSPRTMWRMLREQ